MDSNWSIFLAVVVPTKARPMLWTMLWTCVTASFAGSPVSREAGFHLCENVPTAWNLITSV